MAQTWSTIVERIETPDATTIVFTLERPWNQFPVLLSMGPGMIVAKVSDADGKFTPLP